MTYTMPDLTMNMKLDPEALKKFSEQLAGINQSFSQADSRVSSLEHQLENSPLLKQVEPPVDRWSTGSSKLLTNGSLTLSEKFFALAPMSPNKLYSEIESLLHREVRSIRYSTGGARLTSVSWVKSLSDLFDTLNWELRLDLTDASLSTRELKDSLITFGFDEHACIHCRMFEDKDFDNHIATEHPDILERAQDFLTLHGKVIEQRLAKDAQDLIEQVSLSQSIFKSPGVWAESANGTRTFPANGTLSRAGDRIFDINCVQIGFVDKHGVVRPLSECRGMFVLGKSECQDCGVPANEHP